jgi:hypothetical protein
MAQFKTPPIPSPGVFYDHQAGSTSVWRVRLSEGQRARIALVDGAELEVSSNAGAIVPNDPSVFTETRAGAVRIIEIYGLSAQGSTTPGVAMIEARQRGAVVAYFQAQVSPLSGAHAFFQLAEPQMALNSSDTPVPYSMKYKKTYTSGVSAESIISDVQAVARVNHLVFSCHGTVDPARGGPKIEIGSGFDMSNLGLWDRLFSAVNNVIWFGACALAGSAEGIKFCQTAAWRSGCYVVAPTITLPPMKPAINQIEVFTRSMPHYFAPDGVQISATDFLRLQDELGFKLARIQR